MPAPRRLVVRFGSVILGPALGGVLDPLIGLPGILGVDLTSFGVAIATLITCSIPQPTSDQMIHFRLTL